jgi:hypothetical protein
MIEDKYHPIVEAMARAEAAFNGERWDGYTDKVKRIYLDRVQYAHEKMKPLINLQDRSEIREQLQLALYLEGKPI